MNWVNLPFGIASLLAALFLAPAPQDPTLSIINLDGCTIGIRPKAAQPMAMSQLYYEEYEQEVLGVRERGVKVTIDVPTHDPFGTAVMVSLLAGDIDGRKTIELKPGMNKNTVLVKYVPGARPEDDALTMTIENTVAGDKKDYGKVPVRGRYEALGEIAAPKLVPFPRLDTASKTRARVIVDFHGLQTAFTLLDA